MKPKAILFDMGSTLCRETNFDPQRGTARVLELATENPNRLTTESVLAIRDTFETDFVDRRERSWMEMSPHMVLRHVYEPAGLRFDLPFEEIEREFWATATSTIPIEGALQAVADICDQGIVVGVISNAAITGETLLWQLEGLGFKNRFEFVMYSGDYGVRKPHPLIFQTAARRLQLDPAAVWYVGDSYKHDVEGALTAGMTPVWFKADGSAPQQSDVRVFHCWEDFGALIA